HRLPRILARPDQQEILGEQSHLGKRRLGYRQSSNCGVQSAFRKLLYQLRRQRLTYVNVNFGMRSSEVLHQNRQQIGCDRWDHADAQAARKPIPGFSSELSQLIDQEQDVADAQGGLFAKLGKPDLSSASLHEHGAQSLLQFLDLHRQSRLRDRTSCRRVSEMAMTCQGIEIAKLPNGHLAHQNILSL